MQRIFIMYKLKPEVNINEYRNFSINLDQKITRNQPGVIRFEVFEIKGSEKGEIPYAIVEDIDVENWDEWQKVVNSKEMQPVVEEWSRLADESSAITIFGDKIK